MIYHPTCMQILRREEKNMLQVSVLNVEITKNFLLSWNRYDLCNQFYFRGEKDFNKSKEI